MSLFNRYPTGGKAGVRLDNEENPALGRALDLGRASGGLAGPFTLWVRAHDNATQTLDGLDATDLANLRDGINKLLVAEGVERPVGHIPTPWGVS